MAFDERLAEFFDQNEFAVSSTWTHGGVVSHPSVIFDRTSLSQLGIAGTDPKALVITADFAGWGTADTLAIGSERFRITNLEPLDDGATALLALELQ